MSKRIIFTEDPELKLGVDAINFGDKFTNDLRFEKEYSLSASLDVKYIDANNNKKYINALYNTLEKYKYRSPHYAFSSSYGEKDKQPITLVSIPSIMYGTSIKKGSVELTIVCSGTLLAKVEDKNLNGELIQTYGLNTGSVAGVVLYDEGFILLTGSWDNVENDIHGQRYPWNNWSLINDDPTAELLASSSFDINFNGVNQVQVLTMLAHAKSGEFNHSNNPTFIDINDSQKNNVSSSASSYIEPKDIRIKNITHYPYENYSGSLEKQTYISKIGIYDEKRNLIAVAKLAKPVRKSESRDFTFKLKLDI